MLDEPLMAQVSVWNDEFIDDERKNSRATPTPCDTDSLLSNSISLPLWIDTLGLLFLEVSPKLEAQVTINKIASNYC